MVKQIATLFFSIMLLAQVSDAQTRTSGNASSKKSQPVQVKKDSIFGQFPPFDCLIIENSGEKDTVMLFPSRNPRLSLTTRQDTNSMLVPLIYSYKKFSEKQNFDFEPVEITNSSQLFPYLLTLYYENGSFMISGYPTNSMGNTILTLEPVSCRYNMLKDKSIQIFAPLDQFFRNLESVNIFLHLLPTSKEQKMIDERYGQLKDYLAISSESNGYFIVSEHVSYRFSFVSFKLGRNSKFQSYDTELMKVYKLFKEKGFLVKSRDNEKIVLSHDVYGVELTIGTRSIKEGSNIDITIFFK